MRTWITLLLLPALWLNAAGYRQQPGNDRIEQVIILHTNDMHSKIDNLAKLAYLADSLRARFPNVWLVSSGDNFTGNPVVDMIADPGYPMIDLMNRCGFMVSALGNHEFDMGQESLNRRISQAAFPFICCNLDVSGATLKPLQPWILLKTKSGLEIPFLGIIQLDENGLPSSHPSKMAGIKFYDGISKAAEFTQVKDQYGVLIGLTHLGVEDDVNLAHAHPQFDLILGGHSHTLVDKPMVENGVTILQAGSNLRYVGKTTLDIRNGKIIRISDTLIALNSLKNENPGIRKRIDTYNKNEEFAKVVGSASRPLEGVDEIGSLMAEALRETCKTDIAVQNRGGIRLQSISAGDITLKDIYKLDPFNNPVTVFQLTPDEIRSLLCYGYKLEKGIDLQVSGMTYRIKDNGQFQCDSAEITGPDGKPLDPVRRYSVAMSNYIGVTYKFDHTLPGIDDRYTTAECLINYLRNHPDINYQGVKRSTVAP
ncbi:MAG: bifunctional metallophosphatase/5'-nucleotidase [Alphaproteobacteria bacterium]|nr:bifunctional metallophosphatase/5'-nucleotidase [Alphaproteobacteria bacterium]